MTRSPDSPVPSDSGQPEPEKRDDKAFNCWQEGEANLRAATEVNAVSASSYPPAIMPIQLDLFPGRACPLEAKPKTDRLAGIRKSLDPGLWWLTSTRFGPPFSWRLNENEVTVCKIKRRHSVAAVSHYDQIG